MKIIKRGDLNRINKTKRFECNKCGCIFDADEGEYTVGTQYNDTYYASKCPTYSSGTSNVITIHSGAE